MRRQPGASPLSPGAPARPRREHQRAEQQGDPDHGADRKNAGRRLPDPSTIRADREIQPSQINREIRVTAVRAKLHQPAGEPQRRDVVRRDKCAERQAAQDPAIGVDDSRGTERRQAGVVDRVEPKLAIMARGQRAETQRDRRGGFLGRHADTVHGINAGAGIPENLDDGVVVAGEVHLESVASIVLLAGG